MKGVAYLGESRVEVRDYPVPDPGRGEVLVEMKAAGLCGSDLHKYHRDTEWAAERAGMIAGHEPAGIVSAVGDGVDPGLIGERVSVYHSLGCGRCVHCHAGMPVFCEHEGAFGRTRDGCHADYMTAPANYCLRLPERFSFATGAMLACTAGTAYAALNKLGLSRRDPVVIFGLGPVGMTAYLMAGSIGLKCYGVDLNPLRLELARSLGVGEVIDASTIDVVTRLADKTSGAGVKGALECSGSAVARAQAVQALAVRGTVVVVGVGDETMQFDPERIIRKELSIRGNAVYSTSDYFRLLEFLESNEIDLDRLVTDRFLIHDAVEAYGTFDRGKTGKVVFTWE